MYPYIHITLPSYTVMEFLGGFVSLLFLYLGIDKYKLDFSVFLKLFLASALGGFAGSKLLFAVTQIPWILGHFSFKNLILLILQSGFVFYGGLFGVIFAVLICTKKNPKLRKKVFTLAVPAMPLFHAFGRIGCFLSGCCYGKELSKPYPVLNGIVFSRIPVSLMESAFEFILFGTLVWVRKRSAEADLLRIYLTAYAIFRFANEFLRGDEIRGIFFGLSTAQWISMAIIITYAVRAVLKRRKRNDIPDSD